MSPEHSPARAGASCSAPDASLTIDEFCQAEKISRSSRSRTLFFVRRQGTCRGMLSAHQGKLKAYYFEDNGCHSVSREIWATVHADGVMELGYRRNEGTGTWSVIAADGKGGNWVKKFGLAEPAFNDAIIAQRTWPITLV